MLQDGGLCCRKGAMLQESGYAAGGRGYADGEGRAMLLEGGYAEREGPMLQ